MFLFGLRPTIYLHYIYVNMLRMCSFTYHRGNLLTNRNGDRQTIAGIVSIFATVYEVLKYYKYVPLICNAAFTLRRIS